MVNGKKILKIILAVAALIVIGLFVLVFIGNSHENDPIKQLPSINLTSIDGTIYSTMNLYDKGKPAVIIVFHPECDFCIMEAGEVLNKRDSLRNAQLLFVTSADKKTLSDFLDKYPLDTLTNAKVAIDNNLEFMEIFEIKGPPTSFVYDSGMKLKKVFRGLTDIEIIALAVEH